MSAVTFYSEKAKKARAELHLPLCTNKKCGNVTMFERHHPFYEDKEIRACMSCGTRYVFDSRGNNDTRPSRKRP